MKEIKLGRSGLVAIVDDEDFDRASRYRWYKDVRKNGQHYVKGFVDGQWTRIHRFILGLPMGASGRDHVDHKDGNGLNNRRSNLIQTTHAENIRNGRKHRDARSRYRGVQLLKGKWTANLWLGTFETEEQAAEAYQKAFQGYFGHLPRHASR